MPLALAALAVFVVDYLTKWVATARLTVAPETMPVTWRMFAWPDETQRIMLASAPVRRVPVVPGWFDFFLQHNTGGAFSIMGSYPWLITIVALAAMGWIVWWSRQVPREVVSAHTAFGLVLGGAAGNLFDRLRFGYVVDFLHFYRGEWYWPTFNIADSAIVTGIAVLVVLSLFTKKLEPRAATGDPATPEIPDPK
ncbi:MAG: signal peptidase II [Candidatus Sumerlaeaceae bacterium]|nr:signal peptidase II [Candidatus Sumerlaeaceae bacterium]